MKNSIIILTIHFEPPKRGQPLYIKDKRPGPEVSFIWRFHSSYIIIGFSEISQIDDLHEEYKLSSYRNNHRRTRQEKEQSSTIEEESISQLVELLKTEKEQKVYYQGFNYGAGQQRH